MQGQRLALALLLASTALTAQAQRQLLCEPDQDCRITCYQQGEKKEDAPLKRDKIDRMLMPVYRSKRWVEEAVAIYAERAFGAEYTEGDLRAPGLYGKTRRDWNPDHVFSLFTKELFRPELASG